MHSLIVTSDFFNPIDKLHNCDVMIREDVGVMIHYPETVFHSFSPDNHRRIHRRLDWHKKIYPLSLYVCEYCWEAINVESTIRCL